MTPLGAFLHPALLATGAAAAAVPVIIHLLNRRRVRPQAWAAMTWLLAALKKHQRRLKMENWLILALRCAALLVLGTALARWVVSDSALSALARPRRSVVLLLDTSYSTAARDGARAVADRVREEADKVLASLGNDDVVAVVVSNDVRTDRSGTRPQLLVPRAVGREGASRARAALGSVRPTEAPASWPDALAACAPKALLQDEDVNRVLVWVTDLQARDWRPPTSRGGTDALRDAIEALRREQASIEVVDVGGRGNGVLPNLGVTDLALSETSDVFAGQGFEVVARVVNHGTRTVDGATLRLFVDDAPAPVRTVRAPSLPPTDPTTLAAREVAVPLPVPRDVSFRSSGAHTLRVELTPPEADPGADTLGLDSRRVLALDVRARLRVLVWAQASEKATFDPVEFLRGLFVGEGPGDVFELDAVRDEEGLRRALGDPARPPGFVVLGNRAPRSAETQRDLLRFVREGGALAVFSGDAFDHQAFDAAFTAVPASRLLPFRFAAPETRERRDAPWALDFGRETAHPMSKAFVSGEARFVQSAPPRVFGRTRLLPADAPSTTGTTTTPPPGRAADDFVVLRFLEGDGSQPGPVAVAEGPSGLGRVMYVATALDDAWAPGAILPFYAVLLNDGALAMTRTSSVGRNVAVGTALRASLPKDATAVRLVIPGRGEETPTVRPAPTEEERPEVVHDRVGTAGTWRLVYERPPERGTTTARREEQAFGVNPDAAEGALVRANVAAVENRVPGAAIRVSSGLGEGARVQAAAAQSELTRWLLWAVLGVLLLEPYLAMRFGRHDARAARPSPAAERVADPTGGAS